jgi:TolA-binding protein
MKINWGTGTEMTRIASGLTVIVALLSFALPAMSQQYYIYSPKAAGSEAKENRADGEILVSEIIIRKGDTLSALSRKYSGKGSYYPQILLFNDIKNPNLIRTGDSIRVPVKNDKTGSAETKSRRKAHSKSMPAKALKADSYVAPVTASSEPQKEKNAPAVISTDEQKLFEQASRAYRSGDCRSAIESFERILSEYSSSPLAADASLYKADCLLKLSGQ